MMDDHYNHKPQQGRGSRNSHSGAGVQGAAALTAISAPYNFVPHADFVFKPDWQRAVSHDVPFQDGLSGEIAYTLEAFTPLLVGGKQVKATAETAGSVTPWRDPDDTYAIPGASLKGMLRSVLEIAGFGRMRLVDDRKLSIRDLTRGADWYRHAMAKAKAGWLTVTQTGTEIQPCHFARIDRKQLQGLPGCKDPSFWDKSKIEWAKFQYQKWDLNKLGVRFDLVSGDGPGKIDERMQKLTCGGNGQYQGTLVFTGKPGPKKHLEFVFYNEAVRCLPVDQRVWRGFLQVHEESEDWKYWRPRPRIPVFYLPDGKGGVASLGLAMMYRLPYRQGIHDALRKTSAEHLEVPGHAHGYDLADLLFGAAGDENQSDALGV